MYKSVIRHETYYYTSTTFTSCMCLLCILLYLCDDVHNFNYLQHYLLQVNITLNITCFSPGSVSQTNNMH